MVPGVNVAKDRFGLRRYALAREPLEVVRVERNGIATRIHATMLRAG